MSAARYLPEGPPSILGIWLVGAVEAIPIVVVVIAFAGWILVDPDLVLPPYSLVADFLALAFCISGAGWMAAKRPFAGGVVFLLRTAAMVAIPYYGFGLITWLTVSGSLSELSTVALLFAEYRKWGPLVRSSV